MINYVPFGGKLLVMGDDVRQTLPIVKHGSRDQIVQASVLTSKLWSSAGISYLRYNMRIWRNVSPMDPSACDAALSFSKSTLEVEDGKIEHITGVGISLTSEMCLKGDFIQD